MELLPSSRPVRRRRFAVPAVVLLALAAARGAAAQEVRPPAGEISVLQKMEQQFTPEAARAGSGVIQPAGTLDLSYDSNVLARPHVGDDFAASVEPALEVRSGWTNHALGLKAQGEARQYAVHTSENQMNGSVAANGRADLAPNAYVVGNAAVQRLHEDRGALVAAEGIRPTPVTVAGGAGGIVIEPSPMGFRLDGAIDAYSFDNVTGTLAPINESWRDRVVYSLVPRITYAVIPQYDAFVRAVINRRDYEHANLTPDGIKRDSTGVGGDVGLAIDVPGLAVGEFYLGYLRQDYDRQGLRPIEAVDFGANLMWSPAGATTVRFNVSRSVEESALPGLHGYLQTSVRLALEQELMRDLVALGSAAFIRADFAPGNAGTNIYEFSIGARHFLGNGLTVGLEYLLRHRDKMAFLPAYTRQIVGLRLRSQW